ncbi:myosin-binding protein 3 [Medicago truncatula]|uniref:Zein-binding protein n=2 Tax=Medicago truncatula TaxID=3880 RepID=A0A072VKN8_MEDTR|nr:myosin-binding protein 3 [Medicago truncatula]KEH42589.1 zein-binding protein [Medicago truncatula]
MATSRRGGISFVKSKRREGFTENLTFVACEWFLIFLLLVDSLLSYLVKKFASYCKLQLPCLLCSRLDHILDGEKPEFYHSLLCSDHKSEISSMMLCHTHGKLADGHRMCDDCLLSLTKNGKRNTKTHRLLSGKFGVVIGGSGYQNTPLSRDLFSRPKGSRPCSCCGKLWKLEQNGFRSIQLKSHGRSVVKPYIPLPHAARQSRLNHRDNLKKMRGKTSESGGRRSSHPSSNVGYTVLRLTSDSESEFQFSDDDDTGSIFNEKIEAGNDTIAPNTLETPTKHAVSDLKPPMPKTSSPKHVPLPEVNMRQHGNDNGVEEINRPQADQSSSSSNLPELISLDEVSPSHVYREPESEDCKITDHSEKSLPSHLSELMTLKADHIFVGELPEKSLHVTQAPDNGLVSEEHGKVSEKIHRMEDASTQTDPELCDSAPLSPTQEDSNDMSKSSDSIKEREVPGFVMEQSPSNEIDKVKEELELSPPSQYSSLHESNMSSFVPINHIHSPRIHAEAMESGLESMDLTNMTEIEGESIVDQLKRQIEYDKRYMDDLQKELEEERNASAIAANEAMSMITRLQEEKASLQMEAHQYLRMMEEQAEYDNEELDKVNDLLTEKEKEIQDLEAELDYYRINFMDEPMVPNMHEESKDSKEETVMTQNIHLHNITDTVNNFPDSNLSEVSKGSNEVAAGETSILEFEEEKQYISECLECLEKKVHQLSFNKISYEPPNVRLANLEISKLSQQGDSNSEGPHLDDHEEADLSIQKKLMSNGSHDDKDDDAASDTDDCSISIENNDSTCVEPMSSKSRREADLVALENEISDLHDRLEALEFDHDLIAHITNSLQNGNDGKKFIQDIAQQLRELRKIGIRSR